MNVMVFVGVWLWKCSVCPGVVSVLYRDMRVCWGVVWVCSCAGRVLYCVVVCIVV